jgi:hypothetical protein
MRISQIRNINKITSQFMIYSVPLLLSLASNLLS